MQMHRLFCCPERKSGTGLDDVENRDGVLSPWSLSQQAVSNSDKESKKGYVYVMNLKRLMYKLQTALLCKGVRVKINQFQSYSEQSKRMITKYVLTIPKQHGDKIKNEKLLESYRLSEVVQKLAELLWGGSG